MQPDEVIFIYVNHDFSETGVYTPPATVFNGLYSDSKILQLDLRQLELEDLENLSSNGTKRIFGFGIKNYQSSSNTNVSWTFDTKNSNLINSTSAVILQPIEQVFVYVDYNFTNAGTYNINATGKNGTLTDSMNKTITVS